MEPTRILLKIIISSGGESTCPHILPLWSQPGRKARLSLEQPWLPDDSAWKALTWEGSQLRWNTEYVLLIGTNWTSGSASSWSQVHSFTSQKWTKNRSFVLLIQVCFWLCNRQPWVPHTHISCNWQESSSYMEQEKLWSYIYIMKDVHLTWSRLTSAS